MHRRWLKTTALCLVSLMASALVAEGVMRWAFPWLLPGASGFSRETGLPSGWLEEQAMALRHSATDLVFVGDSFVATGVQSRGWVSRLRQLTGRTLVGLGVMGACPSQYVAVRDALRLAGVRAPIGIVLYIGNDFADESVWAGVGADRSHYDADRIDFYSDPTRPTYWPCFQLRPEYDRPGARLAHALRRHSAVFRASLLALGGAAGEEGLSRYMGAECDRAPWAERRGGRLFFFRLHDASVDPGIASIAAAQATVRDALARRKADGDLFVIPVLDREETCSSLHQRPVARAAPFIEALRAQGLSVLDTNADMATECAARQIYLPDGHWTAEGHDAFARSLQRRLTEKGLLGEG